ncbi:MAG TPA: hypothetical protein VIU61_12270, partial [Kofleriaceae bacterium]
DVFTAVLAGVALVILIIIGGLRKRLVPKQSLEDDGRRTDLETTAPPGFVAALPKLRSSLIIIWGLCEMIAVLGLVVAFVTRDGWGFVYLGVPGAAAMLITAPTRKLLESVLRANR